MDFQALISTFANNLLPILLVSGAGFLLGKALHVDSRGLGRVVFYVFSPILVFNLLLHTKLDSGQIATTVLFTLLVYGVIGSVAYVSGRLMGLERPILMAVVLTAASGNSGTKARYYPACLDGVVAVGSVGPDEQPSHFTTRGDHVDISAPGEQVPSTAMGGGYQLNTGTSFAAPFVAPACALLDARAARYARPLDGDAARELLKQTARPFPREADSKGCGAGILDVPAALRRLESDLNSPNEEPTGWEPPVREPPELARAP